MRITLHATAAGKAYLAHLPREEVDRIVDDVGLPADTESTISGPEALLEQLKTVREGVSRTIGASASAASAVSPCRSKPTTGKC